MVIGPTRNTASMHAIPRSVWAQARAVPACVVRPAQTEGPYFVEEQLERADIRSDPRSGAAKAGMPLRLSFVVSRVSAGACGPLAGVQVDLRKVDLRKADRRPISPARLPSM